jgi:integrase
MGTVVKRTDNAGRPTFQARVRRKGRADISKNFRSVSEADRWVDTQETSIERGSFIDDRSLHATLLRALFARYEAEVSPLKRGYETEQGRLKRMQQWPLANYSLAALSGDVMRAWRDARLREVAGSTVNRELNLIGHVLETARKEWGYPIVLNAVQQIRRPKNPPHRDRRLQPGEEEALLTAADRTRGGYLRNLIELALETAMRRGELLALQWRDVSIERRTAHIRMSKTGKGRGVPLSRKAVAVLQRIPQHSARVFDGVTYEAVKQSFPRACDWAGITDLRLHDLRHEATSRFIEKGLSIAEAASITGHSSASMLQVYVHLQAWKLADKLD